MTEYTTDSNIYFRNDTAYEDYNEFEKEISALEYEIRHYRNIFIFITRYITSLAVIIVTVAVICSTCFISFLIYKFRRLRTRTNYILLNLMITSTIFTLTVSFLCIIETFAAVFLAIYYEYIINIVFIIGFMSINTTLLFVLYLAIDWLILANNFNVLSKCQQSSYRFIILGIYIFSLKDYLVFLLLSDKTVPYLAIETISAGLLFIITGIIVLALFIMKKCKRYSPEQSKTDYSLAISCTFFAMWLPVLVTFICTIIILFLLRIRLGYKYYFILTLICQALSVFGLASPIAYLVVLSKLDMNFKASFNYVFKKAVRNYTQHECDEDFETV